MNKSAFILTNSSDKPSSTLLPNIRTLRNYPSRILLVTVLLVVYYLPWVITSSASLTLGAYDLAEWASLHPQLRASNPAFLTSFMLRVVMLCIIVTLAVSQTVSMAQRRLKILLILILFTTLLPPLEFFRNASEDPNFRQQFALALSTILFAGSVGFMRNIRFHRWIGIVVAAAAIVCSIIGLAQAFGAIKQFQIGAAVGESFLAFLLVYTVILLSEVLSLRNK